mgnify:FL=1
MKYLCLTSPSDPCETPFEDFEAARQFLRHPFPELHNRPASVLNVEFTLNADGDFYCTLLPKEE